MWRRGFPANSDSSGCSGKERCKVRLYHTGKMEIRSPDIHRGRKNADFGQGFYLTPDREFAHRWAGADAILNEYELDESGLLIHLFSHNGDWFRYIMENRRARDDLSADVVMGPVANDTIFDTLGVIGSGFLTSEDSLKLLQIGPKYTQVAIKTEKAASQLRWISSGKVAGWDEKSRKAEQDAYEIALAKAFWEISART